jgi:ElaB/YqjD/DUF883 family membrane-anchored ribosome-binding protein
VSEQAIYVPARNRSDTPQRLMNEVAGEKIAAARARAEESLRTARIRLSQAGDEVAESARATMDAAHEYARANPWKALAIAFGLGFLTSLLLGRR